MTKDCEGSPGCAGCHSLTTAGACLCDPNSVISSRSGFVVDAKSGMKRLIKEHAPKIVRISETVVGASMRFMASCCAQF